MPTLSPAAGIFASGTTVAISSSTGGASIYYTTDGTTPAVTLVSGVPTPSGTTALYSSPIALSNSSSAQVIKAIAYHPGTTLTASEVASGTFIANAKFIWDTGAASVPNTTEYNPAEFYDSDGRRVSGNGGGIFYDPVSSHYYWHGWKPPNPTGEPGRGVSAYRSTDLYNWEYRGLVAPNAIGLSATLADVTRVHVARNPTPSTPDNAYVMVANLYEIGYAVGYIGFATSPSPDGPFTWVNKQLPGGYYPGDVGGIFIDDDGTWYTIHNADHALRMIACVLDPATDYTSFTGTTIELDTSTGKEDPAIFKRSGRYWLISGAINYGAINSVAVYKTATTLAGLASASFASLWSSAPATYSVALSAQPTGVFDVQGRTDSRILMFDWWCPGQDPLQLNQARMCWLPITATSFPTSTTLQLDPATTSWDLSVFPSPPGGLALTGPGLCGANPLISFGGLVS